MRSEITNIGLTEARSSLGKIVENTMANNSAVILEKSGSPVAAVVSMKDFAKIQKHIPTRKINDTNMPDYESIGKVGFHSASFVDDDEDYSKW